MGTEQSEEPSGDEQCARGAAQAVRALGILAHCTQLLPLSGLWEPVLKGSSGQSLSAGLLGLRLISFEGNHFPIFPCCELLRSLELRALTLQAGPSAPGFEMSQSVEELRGSKTHLTGLSQYLLQFALF